MWAAMSPFPIKTLLFYVCTAESSQETFASVGWSQYCREVKGDYFEILKYAGGPEVGSADCRIMQIHFNLNSN